MKQGIALRRTLTFSALTFSLLSGIAAHAQLIEVAPPADESTSNQPISVDGPAEETTAAQAPALRNDAAVNKAAPVAVTPGMSPATVPAAQVLPSQTLAQTQMQSQTQTQGQAPTGNVTPAAGSVGGNPNSGAGNSGTVASSSLSNGSGTQINLNLPLNQQQNQKADQDVGLDQSRVTELKMEKKIREQVNEERMLERIEEDRINGERTRTRGIEHFKFAPPDASASASASASTDLETSPVTGVGSSTAIAVATAGPGDGSHGFFSDVRFKVVPVVGARWNQNRNTMFTSNGAFTGGVNLEGQVNRYFSIEGGFLFGHENFNYNNIMAYGAGYGGMGYGGGGYGLISGGGYNSMGYGYNAGYIYGPNSATIIAPRSRNSYEVSVGAKLGYQVNKVRPYLSAGIGGLFQKYQIDDAYTVAYLQAAGWTRSTDHAVANFGLGTDFDLAKNFALGARFEYQAILNPTQGSYNMNQIWGDASNRFRLTGNLQIVF